MFRGDFIEGKVIHLTNNHTFIKQHIFNPNLNRIRPSNVRYIIHLKRKIMKEKKYQEQEAEANKNKAKADLSLSAKDKNSVQMIDAKTQINKKEIEDAIDELNPDENSRDRG